MTEQNHPLDTLQDIKQMMERSSRFISLSGLSGVAAGLCALAGAWFANMIITTTSDRETYPAVFGTKGGFGFYELLGNPLLHLAAATFVAALVLAFIFTYLRSRKNNMAIWGRASRRLLINMCIPLLAGGLFVLKIIEVGAYTLIAPGCLIFYGLALVNAAKYTLSEVRYLGYCQLIIGALCLYFGKYGLYFWALGFGVLHIVYGIAMWWKYERGSA